MSGVCLVASLFLAGCSSGPDIVLFEGQSDPWTTPVFRVTSGDIPMPKLTVRDSGDNELPAENIEYLVCKGTYAQGATAGGQARPATCSDDLDTLEDIRKAGDTVVVDCEPDCRYGSVRGTDVYAGSSGICTSAIHAGAIGPEGGRVVVTGADASSEVKVEDRNGISARAYRPDPEAVAYTVKADAGTALSAAWPFCTGDQVAASTVQDGMLRVSPEDTRLTVFARVGTEDRPDVEQDGRRHRAGVGLVPAQVVDLDLLNDKSLALARLTARSMSDVPGSRMKRETELGKGMWTVEGLPDELIEIGTTIPVHIVVGTGNGERRTVKTVGEFGDALGVAVADRAAPLTCESFDADIASVGNGCDITGVGAGSVRLIMTVAGQRLGGWRIDVDTREAYEARKAQEAQERAREEAERAKREAAEARAEQKRKAAEERETKRAAKEEGDAESADNSLSSCFDSKVDAGYARERACAKCGGVYMALFGYGDCVRR